MVVGLKFGLLYLILMWVVVFSGFLYLIVCGIIYLISLVLTWGVGFALVGCCLFVCWV